MKSLPSAPAPSPSPFVAMEPPELSLGDSCATQHHYGNQRQKWPARSSRTGRRQSYSVRWFPPFQCWRMRRRSAKSHALVVS